MFGKKRQARKSASSKTSTFSYYSTQSSSETQPDRSRKTLAIGSSNLSRHIKHTPTILAAAAIIVSLSYFLMLSPNSKVIQTSHTSSLFLQSFNTYQSAANKLFGQSLLNRNKITVNVSGITESLKREFPELADVSITLPLAGHRPIVYIQPSQPIMLLSTQADTYVISEKGTAIIRSSSVKDLISLNLPTVKDLSGLDVKLGQAALPVDDVNFTQQIIYQFSASNQPISGLTLPRVPNELDVQLKGKSFYLKFNTQADPKEQVGAYLASLKYLDRSHRLPTKYFDLRVEGKVYYK